MEISFDGKNQYIVALTDKEIADIKKLAEKEKCGFCYFLEQAFRSGINLYRYIILGKE